MLHEVEAPLVETKGEAKQMFTTEVESDRCDQIRQ